MDHERCSGTGRAMAFVYAKAPRDPARRLRPCASCGERFTGRELVEVGPEEAKWSLKVSEGDVLCRPCVLRAGVL